jgi:predicted enzyme related to lactoylglutathione lyase
MEMQVLFASIPVVELATSVAWYKRFFGRPFDIDVNPTEVMWRIGDGAWLYLIEDRPRAGNGLVAISVADLDAAIRELGQQGIEAGTVEPQGEGALKSIVTDPDGNSLALLQVN